MKLSDIVFAAWDGLCVTLDGLPSRIAVILDYEANGLVKKEIPKTELSGPTEITPPARFGWKPKCDADWAPVVQAP